MTNFKIISFDENQGSVTVRYSDLLPPVAVDVPLDENGLYVTGEALNEHIKGFIPVEFLARGEKIKQGIANADDVKSMVEAEAEAADTQAVEQTHNAIMWENVATEQSVAKMLVKWGVLTQDPTVIPVATQ